ncbi:MAG: type IV secretion system DNA-binding domain-containing protein [Flavobacteriia bacterium]|nr:type IV secretion system DNA-binding domain-containing protein [Flavobacteriia bacterium]
MAHIFNPYISYFAQTDFRDQRDIFGIYQHDRFVGMYLLGKTGTGKTNVLETLIHQDVLNHRGLCLFDINGDLVKQVLASLPQVRKKDLVYLDTSNINIEWGYNPLRKVSYQHRHLIASHIIETFQNLWGQQSWGIKLEHILRNAILTLLDQPKATFSDITRILIDEDYRLQCHKHIIAKEVREFWTHQFSKYSKADVLPVLNKIGSFLAIPMIKKILVDNTKQLSIQSIINNQRIFLVNLSKGTLGADAAHLLGSLLLNSLSAAGFHRSTIAEDQRKPFFIYLDEFHNFTTLSLVNMFSELRKFKIGFIVAHQYLNQLPVKIKEAVLGNIGTMICFRISYADAKFMAQEFYPIIKANDFVELENFHIYLKLMIDGKPSKPFSAKTITKNWLQQPKG